MFPSNRVDADTFERDLTGAEADAELDRLADACTSEEAAAVDAWALKLEAALVAAMKAEALHPTGDDDLPEEPPLPTSSEGALVFFTTGRASRRRR